MTRPAQTLLPTFIIMATGVLWGVYWIPVRAMDDLGLTGAWGTLAVVVGALLVLVGFALRQGLSVLAANWGATVAMLIGGAAFVMYSVGFLYGRIAMITVLFYLTPVWSVLIAKYVMGWDLPRLRIFAIGVGLLGLLIMLVGDGGVPLPDGLGEWMALASGLLWSISTTRMRALPALPQESAAFAFVLGAVLTAGVLAPLLAPVPRIGVLPAPWLAFGLAVITGAFWWGLSLSALLWAAPQLDPARVGILLMAEVIVGAATAAWLAGEMVSGVEIAGGVLVLAAGVLEVWPTRAGPREVAA